MKILHITYSDNYGGANIAANRIHKSLLNHKSETKLLVIDKKTNNKNVIQYKYLCNIFSKKIRPYFEKLLIFFLGFKSQVSLNLLQSNIASFANKNNFDVINLHWINNEMMSLSEISKFNGKIFWTLHDAWPLENFSHYPDSSQKIVKNFFVKKTLSYLVNKKKNNLNIKKINIICPSNWIKKIALNNKILNVDKIKIIRNPIDTNFWKPLNTKKLKIKTILFGSVGVSSDKRKGLQNFLTTLNQICENIPKFQLLVFGGGIFDYKKFNFNIVNLGYLNKQELRKYYNMANVYVVTSTQDNLPNTAIEAMSCGTPVITDKNNGLNEIINNKQNGYIMDKFSKEQLLFSLKWALKDKNKKLIHSLIKKNFSQKKISQQYLDFYKKI
tara:strand:- start:2638 stop:3792 length:1155 start_codon:yes stop_codon:yes gene_type:complete